MIVLRVFGLFSVNLLRPLADIGLIKIYSPEKWAIRPMANWGLWLTPSTPVSLLDEEGVSNDNRT